MRVWLTNVYVRKYFNRFVKGQIKEEILKRVIANGNTESSWLFKRFNKLLIIVTNKASFSNLLSSSCFFQQMNKMDFIQFEPIEKNLDGNHLLDFLDENADDEVIDEVDFIGDRRCNKEDVSFCRNVDLDI